MASISKRKPELSIAREHGASRGTAARLRLVPGATTAGGPGSGVAGAGAGARPAGGGGAGVPRPTSQKASPAAAAAIRIARDPVVAGFTADSREGRPSVGAGRPFQDRRPQTI